MPRAGLNREAPKIPALLFAVTFIAFAYFHPGGGWNQNARFAMVRAIVEEGHLSIDSHLVYAGAPSHGGARLVRIPVQNAEFALDGRTYAFRWHDTEGRPIYLNAAAGAGTTRDVEYVAPGQVGCSGDVAFHAGRFHPAKAPGGSFAAVPAYFLIHVVERMTGVDPDDWWTLTVNAWLTSVFTVGLLAALGCVLLYRLALKLSGGRRLESALTALAFAFGTPYFPYATTLYEHDIIAVALIASFYLLLQVKDGVGAATRTLSNTRARAYIGLAGLCAGWAAITNYIMAIAVVVLGCYLVFAVKWRGGWRWFVLGLLGPFLLICAYNVACFGTPFTTNYRFEDPYFRSAGHALLGVFVAPQWEALLGVLISPYRGLFFCAPVLLLGVYGLTVWTRDRRVRAEAWVMVALVLSLCLFTVTFNGWDGGWAVGPRYLVPAIPFLALPLVIAFTRLFKTTCALALVSVAIGLLVTAVDPQSPVGASPKGTIADRPRLQHSPLTDYELPLFFELRAAPLLRAQRDAVLRAYDRTMQARGDPAPIRVRRVEALRDRIDTAITAGQPAPLVPELRDDGSLAGVALSDLPLITGPVSVNPIGMYEGGPYRVFDPRSRQARWNAFNLGEFLFEESRLSLIPLLMVTLPLVVTAIRMAARRDAVHSPGG